MQAGPKSVWNIPYVSCFIFSKFKTEFYCISFFTSYDNQALVGCIPIADVAVNLNLKL